MSLRPFKNEAQDRKENHNLLGVASAIQKLRLRAIPWKLKSRKAGSDIQKIPKIAQIGKEVNLSIKYPYWFLI